MNRWATALAVFVLCLAVLGAAYKYLYPTYSYRYRLTINIEAEGKLHTGSSVIEVTWYAHFLPEFVSFSPELRGQAALVDLGDRGAVVATLLNGESYGPAQDGAWGAIWIATRAFGLNSTTDELPRLPQLRGKRDLASDNLSRFLWFSNPKDPASASNILVQEFPTTLGSSVHFAGATIEITNDPIVIDIRDKLPWLQSFEQRLPGDDVIYLPNKFPIARFLFIGDRS